MLLVSAFGVYTAYEEVELLRCCITGEELPVFGLAALKRALPKALQVGIVFGELERYIASTLLAFFSFDFRNPTFDQ